MPTIVDNINSLKTDLVAIRNSIISKGVDVPNNTPLREFANKIDSIQSGSSISEKDQNLIDLFKNRTDWSHAFRYYPDRIFPKIDTSHVTNMSYMFANSTTLTIIRELDTTSVTSMEGIFYQTNRLAGLTFNPNAGNLVDFSIANCTDMPAGNLVLMIESLPTLTDKTVRITLGSTLLNRLSSDQIAIATNKGYTLA